MDVADVRLHILGLLVLYLLVILHSLLHLHLYLRLRSWLRYLLFLLMAFLGFSLLGCLSVKLLDSMKFLK